LTFVYLNIIPHEFCIKCLFSPSELTLSFMAHWFWHILETRQRNFYATGGRRRAETTS